MLFEKVVLFEANDWTKYFNSVSDAVMNFFKEVGADDILMYVSKGGSLIKPGDGVLPEKKHKAKKKEKSSESTEAEKKAEETAKLAKEANDSKEISNQAETARNIVLQVFINNNNTNNGSGETTKEVKTPEKKTNTPPAKPAVPPKKKPETNVPDDTGTGPVNPDYGKISRK